MLELARKFEGWTDREKVKSLREVDEQGSMNCHLSIRQRRKKQKRFKNDVRIKTTHYDKENNQELKTKRACYRNFRGETGNRFSSTEECNVNETNKRKENGMSIRKIEENNREGITGI